MNQNTIKSVAAHFSFGGTLANIKELTAGNINVTYRLTYTEDGLPHQYIIQRINTNAFKDPVSLMDNVGKVTAHIRASYQAEGINPDRRVLTFVPSDNGTLLYTDPEGGAWRAYHYVDGVTAYDQIESADLFREAGRGFGEFQTRLADFPAAELVETIPGFHNTAHRYGAFLKAIEEDAAGRVASIPDDIAFFKDRKDLAHAIVSKMGDPDMLPLRVTHNDTKLNNVLIDNATGKALCVIDLDTVMPGSSLYDYGDAVRYGACTAAEDEPDTSKIDFDMTLVEAFTEGFVSATAGKLTDTEIRLLPLGVKVITYELAMRFLTDYVSGDVYFKTNYAEHNLVRARAQMKLLTVVEEKYDEMCRYIEEKLKR
ncbi:MAG: aminoglycoside phosphotransferase family protein [Ruminococcaceae bacterium]|nr:aminoglycoside phosphotransferase family protein [Oscillospiraceae bacterium]